MGQVADGGIRRVVRLGGHRLNMTPHGRPQGGSFLKLNCKSPFNGREDHLFAGVQVHICMVDAGQLFASNRMARHKCANVFPQDAPRGIYHVAFGRPNVHDQRVVCHQMPNSLERGLCSGHRNGQQYDVGT